MDEFKEFQGKSLDEAIQNACTYYNAAREKLEIDIVQDAKNGIFGLVGARKAVVRARRVAARVSMAQMQMDTRLERSETSERPGRPERGERSERQERGERAERQERGERSERQERGERSERQERGERGERQERGDRSDRQPRAATCAEDNADTASEAVAPDTENAAPRRDDEARRGRNRRGRRTDGESRPREFREREPREEDAADGAQAESRQPARAESRAEGRPEGRADGRRRRAERPERGERRDRGDRPERPARAERPECRQNVDPREGGESDFDDAGDGLARIPFDQLDQAKLHALALDTACKLVSPILGPEFAAAVAAMQAMPCAATAPTGTPDPAVASPAAENTADTTAPVRIVMAAGHVEAHVCCGENSGLLIGREGQTLSSLQYLASRMVSRGMGASVRVQFNVGDYRERQDDRLRELALSLAERVRATGRSCSTRPMSSYHRRIIHLALQDSPDVQTRSSGDGPLKRIIVQRRKNTADKPDESRDLLCDGVSEGQDCAQDAPVPCACETACESQEHPETTDRPGA